MLSEAWAIEKDKKILMVHKAFLQCQDVTRVSKVTKISYASVKRYLTCDRARELVGSSNVDKVIAVLDSINNEKGKARRK